MAIITETWLHDQIPDNDVFPHGFKVFRRDRGSRGGGVALLIKDTIPCMSIEHGQDCEMVWASIRFGCQSMLVGAVYRCPQASIDVLQSLSEFLLTKTKQFSRIVMAGDFNLPDIDWNCVMPNAICNQSRLLVGIAFSNNLSQVVKCPTRVSNDRESLLDLVFLSEVVTRSILDVSIADGISDHAIVVCDLSAPQHAHNETEAKSYRDFNRANDIDIIDFLEVALDRFLAFYNVNPDSVDKLWLFFKQVILTCVDKFIPERPTKRKRHNPWVTRDILHLKRKINRVDRFQPSLKFMLPPLRQELRTLVRTSKYRYFNVTMHNFLVENPRKFWAHLTKKKKG